MLPKKTFFVEYTYKTSNVKVYGNESSCTIEVYTVFNDRLVNARPSFPVSNVIVDSGRSAYGRIEISVSGSTASIEELVRNSDNYRVKVWFRNLQCNNRYSGDATKADVLKLDIVKAGE